jgi:hypothetical protein
MRTRARSRDQEQQGNARVAHDVAERIDAVVAAAVRHHQRLVVVDADEAGKVTARRAIEPFRPAGRKRRKRRFLDQRAIGLRHPIGNLDRGSVIGKSVDRLKLFNGRDNRHHWISRQVCWVALL